VLVLAGFSSPAAGLSGRPLAAAATGTLAPLGRGITWLRRRPRVALVCLAALALFFLIGWLALPPRGPDQIYLADLKHTLNRDDGTNFMVRQCIQNLPGLPFEKLPITIEGSKRQSPHGIFMRSPAQTSSLPTIAIYDVSAYAGYYFKASVTLT